MATRMCDTKTKTGKQQGDESKSTIQDSLPVDSRGTEESTKEELSALYTPLMAAMNVLPVGMIMMEADGTCLLLNPIAETALKKRSSQKAGENILDIAPNDTTRNVFETLLKDCIKTGKASREFKLDDIIYKAKAHSIPASKSHSEIVVLFLENISARTIAENKKNDLLALVSHELRTPLTVIKGYLDIFTEEILGSVSPEQLDCIKVMQEQCINLDLRIKDLIRYSGLTRADMPVNPENIMISPFLDNLIGRKKESLKSMRTNVSFVVPDPMLNCFCDPGQLEDLLRHLIENAIKFSYPGVSVVVRAEMLKNKDLPPIENRIIPRDLRPELKWVRLDVEDNGPGIPKEKINQIFESFEQGEYHLTRKSKGLGLGLALVKEIVTYNEGTLWINSVENRGTYVTVVLPQANPKIEG